MKYLRNLLLALDALAAAILFRAQPGVTVSAWCGYKWPGGWAERAIDALFYKGHCQGSINWPLMRHYYG